MMMCMVACNSVNLRADIQRPYQAAPVQMLNQGNYHVPRTVIRDRHCSPEPNRTTETDSVNNDVDCEDSIHSINSQFMYLPVYVDDVEIIAIV